MRCEAESASDGSSNWYRINWDKNAFEMQAVNFRITQVLGSTESTGSNVTDGSSTAAPTGPTDLEPTPTLNSSNYTPPNEQQGSSGQNVSVLEISEAHVTNQSTTVPLTTVIAAAAGAAAFVIVLLILVGILLNKVKRQKKVIEMTTEEIDEFLQGMPWHKAQANGISGLFVLPYDTRLEIPKTDVDFCKTSTHRQNLMTL